MKIIKRKKKTFNKSGILLALLVLIGAFCIIKDFTIKNELTEEVFKTKDYTYLPKAAYNYVIDYYDKTGIILRTEKNKIENEPYLNPEYVTYLSLGTSENSEENGGYVPQTTIVDMDYSQVELGTTSFPSQYDSRNVDGKSYVTSVKNQAGYELCWDFALTSVLESKILKENKYTGSNELDLSERQIDYASASPMQAIDIGFNPYFNGYPLSNIGGGGNVNRYFGVVSNGVSPITEEQWKNGYTTDEKYSPIEVWNIENVEYDVDGYYEMPKSINQLSSTDSIPDEDFINALKKLIMENGSVEINLPVSHNNPYVYYKEADATAYTYLYYRDETYPFSNNHSIAIIGWNDNYEHNVCVGDRGSLSDSTYSKTDDQYTCSTGTLKNIKGAWIAKNSYGESGNMYPYVAYASVNNQYSSIYAISEKDYDNVYSAGNAKKETHDKFRGINNYEKMATNEKIKKIKFTSSSANTTATIFVDVDNSGEYEEIGKVNVSYPGLYTLDVSSKDILLNKDSFNVKVELANEEDRINMYSGIQVFTENVEDTILIDMDNVELENTILNQQVRKTLSITDSNIIMLTGKSRNLTTDKEIVFEVKNSQEEDVTEYFQVHRNYAVSNYINAFLSFNEDVEKGDYTVTASVDGHVYDTFTLTIGKYSEILSGEGTEENPYIITNPEQLNMIRTQRYSFYKLGNDIDLTYDTQDENGMFYNDGKGWEPILFPNPKYKSISYFQTSGFSGGFDGDGYNIKGLYINRPEEDGIGLFGAINNENYANVYVKNVTLENPNITGKDYVGGIIGFVCPGNYERKLTLENLGIINGQITGNKCVGGIVGYLFRFGNRNLTPGYIQKINNMYNSATIIATENYAGGLFGRFQNYEPTIKTYTVPMYNLFNVGLVTASNGYASGILGYADGYLDIYNTFNTGFISGKNTNLITNGNNLFTLTNAYYLDDETPPITKGNSINVKKVSVDYIKNDDSYESWVNFSDNYQLEKTEEQNYFPTLKNTRFKHVETMTPNKNIISISLDGSKTSDLAFSIDTDIENKNIYYYSEDTSIAIVSQDGTVTAKTTGNTNIVGVSYYDGTTVKVPLTVTGTVINVENITLEFDKLTMYKGAENTLNVNISPSNATNQTITWTSSDESVAEVNRNGKVTAKKAGKTFITATTEDGSKTATCEVDVIVKVNTISLNSANLSLQENVTEQLNASITPSDATNQNVTWTSSDESVAEVDQNGKVTAKKTGTTIITATTEDGNKTATCTITVSASRLIGDVNNDGKITISDITRLYKHIKKINIITDKETLDAADVNNDTGISISDLTRLYKYVKGIIDKL